MEETIQIVKRMWAEAPASFEGKYYRIENACVRATAKSRPEDPDRRWRRAKDVARRGQTRRLVELPRRHVENYARKLDVLRQHCDEIGRDYGEIVKTWSAEGIALGATEAEARRVAETSLWKKDVLVGTPDADRGAATGLRRPRRGVPDRAAQ